MALATNMISVGLDIRRLGLMLVQGQPKTAAEYIQATSRVGRDKDKPGLVLAVLNAHKPRDRMHYEQFRHFHACFYRAVEATSVTPWAARALDRALAAVVVAIARHLDPAMVAESAAATLARHPEVRAAVRDALLARAPDEAVAGGHAALGVELDELLDGWEAVAKDYTDAGDGFQLHQAVCAGAPAPAARPVAEEPETGAPALRCWALDAGRRGQLAREGVRSVLGGGVLMAREVLRLSQLVGVFGPGAMLDLPERSVLVGGLNHWDMSGKDAFKVIEEERLSRLLEQFLRRDGEDGRVAKGRPLQLRTPPVEPGFGQVWQGNGGAPPAGVRVAVFPTVFTCDNPDASPPGQPGNRRRMVRWQDLDPSHQRRRYVDDGGKKHDVTPIRFVCGCQSGHLQDIDWRWVTHGDGAKSCHEPMWLEETGTSGEPSATRVVCGCGKSLSLDELFQPGRLGMCGGERPWIGDRDPVNCDLLLRLLTRSATNTYFPQVAVVISLPEADDELTRRVREHLSVLRNAAGPEQVGMARMFNPALGEALKGYDDAEIFARLQRLLAQGDAQALADPRRGRVRTARQRPAPHRREQARRPATR